MAVDFHWELIIAWRKYLNMLTYVEEFVTQGQMNYF